MPRIRTIKPEFWTDEKIGKLKRDERLLFIGLWNIADDQGVVKSNPAYIKGQLFSYDEELRLSTVKDWLASLVKARMLVPFTFNGESYYIIRTFEEHQLINRPSKPKFPEDLITGLLQEESPNTHGVLTEPSQPEGNGKETEGKGESGGGAADAPKKTKFEKFEDWIKKNAPNVSKMKEPFTEEQYNEMVDKFNSEVVKDVLKAMHNHKPLLKNNITAYFTLCNWIKRREETGTASGNNSPKANGHASASTAPPLSRVITPTP